MRRSSIQRDTRGLRRRLSHPANVPDLPAPAGLRASTVELDSDEYLVLSYPAPAWNLPSSLTTAERNIALAILRGTSTETIAQERCTSARTVANQIAAIFEKVGVKSRIELARVIGTRGSSK
jgi:DNA-binding NarL/FixJ family response regulator